MNERAPHDLANQLIALGFKTVSFMGLSDVEQGGKGDGDFAVFDESDGNGPYIKFWLSDEPCPFPQFLRSAAQ